MLGARGLSVAMVQALRATVPERLEVMRKDLGRNTYQLPGVAKYTPTGKWLVPISDMPAVMVEVMDDKPVPLRERDPEGPTPAGLAYSWRYTVRARVLASAGAVDLAEEQVMLYLQAVREALLSMPGVKAGPHELVVSQDSLATSYTELHAADQDATAYIGSGYVRWTVDTLEVLQPAELDAGGTLEQVWLKVDHVLPPDGVLDPTFTEPPEFTRVPPSNP